MLEIICQGVPDRLNEDAFVAYQRDDGQPRYVLAAIDGATSVASYAPLSDYLRTQRNGITPAALAAAVSRDAILAQLGSRVSNDDISPRELILHANHALRNLLLEVAPGIYDPDAIQTAQPDQAHLLDDPRKIRLFLPAAVVTLITVDTELNLLRFAHAGDTSLLVGYEDGHASLVTQNASAPMNYESALALATQTVVNRGLSMLDAVNDPVIRALDRDHRIYHNYVDKNGDTVVEQGVGVVDGLPELADYVQSGMVMLDNVTAAIVLSDGFLWPASLHETAPERQNRLNEMWGRIRRDGLKGYLTALRTEERADAKRERYPRFKLHDDATAVALWLS